MNYNIGYEIVLELKLQNVKMQSVLQVKARIRKLKKLKKKFLKFNFETKKITFKFLLKF